MQEEESDGCERERERESSRVCSILNTALFIMLLKSKIPSHKPQAAASWKQLALGTYCELNPLAPGRGVSTALLLSHVQRWFSSLEENGRQILSKNQCRPALWRTP